MLNRATVSIATRCGDEALDAGNELGVQRRIGVTTADYTAHTLAFELIELAKHGPDRQSAGRLRFEIGESEEQSHTLLDLILADFDHTRQTLAEDLPVEIADLEDARAIGDRVGLLRQRDDVAGAERQRGVVR